MNIIPIKTVSSIAVSSITDDCCFFYIIYYTHTMSCSLYHFYTCMLCCSWSSNMNIFIGLVFLLLLSVYMCYGLSHCMAQYFAYRLYDSALATIILNATWLDLTWLNLLCCYSMSPSRWTGIVLEQAAHHVGGHWLAVQWQDGVHHAGTNARTFQQDGNVPARDLRSVQLA